MSLSATLRPRFHHVLRNVIHPIPTSSTSSFHISAPVRAVSTSQKIQAKKNEDNARKPANVKPDPITGHRPGDEAKWLNCDLAKILIDEKHLHDPTVTVPPMDINKHLSLPENFQWGIGGDAATKDFLFDSLPEVSAQQSIHEYDGSAAQRKLIENQWHELRNAHLISRLVDLRNASASGIAFENRRRCIAAFSEPGKPNDTGRPEVQAALLTMKIRRLHVHLQRNRKDVANRLSIRKLVHARAKMLKYLRRLDRDRFEKVMRRLGMEENSIEGELIVY